MHANHRHYILFTLAFITFVVTTLGYAFLRNKVYSQAVNSADLLKSVGEMEQKLKRDQDVTQAYSKLTEEQKLVTTYIASRERAVDFIEMVEKVGADTSTEIAISDIRANEIVRTSNIEDNFTHLNARIEASGSWANVMRALTLLENMPFSVTLNNVHLFVDSAPEPDEPKTGTSTKSVVKARTWRLALEIKVLAI